MLQLAYVAVLLIWQVGQVNASAGSAAESAKSQQQPKTAPKEKPAPKEPAASMAGCIDEQDGVWVLVNDQTRATIANLVAEGFPTEGFAKHLGHKVTVRGTASSDGSHPLFKVRSIETISETCSSR